MAKKINEIFIHHSASYWGNALVIDKWHKERGWKGIGYHFVITNGIPTYEDYKHNRKFKTMVGQIEYGRPLDADPWLEAREVGAHVYGYNSDSIGICLIHRDEKYEPKMIQSLTLLVNELRHKFNVPIKNIRGHYEVEPKKPDCPSIDMDGFRKFLKLDKEPKVSDINLR